MNKSFCHWI